MASIVPKKALSESAMSIPAANIGFEQQTSQERNAPSLQPSDLLDYCDCINQAPVP